MNIRNLSWVLGGALTFGLVTLAACSSSTTTTGTDSDGGNTSSSSSSSSSGSSGASGADLKAAAIACGLVDGAEYTTHSVVGSGSDSTCMAPEDTTGTSSFDDSDAGTEADSGIACTTTVSGCVFTTTCSGVSGGYTVDTTDTETISADGVTGVETTKITAADGGVFQNCTYDVTVTKD